MASSSHCAIDEEQQQKLYGPQQEWEPHPTDVEPEFIGACAESLIPRVFTKDDILQAFDLWDFPKEAYPENPEVVYTLQNQTNPEGTESILVLLWKQAFKTKPLHKKHAHWSFWTSPQCGDLGAVENPCWYNVQESGYNHSSAVLAFGS